MSKEKTAMQERTVWKNQDIIDLLDWVSTQTELEENGRFNPHEGNKSLTAAKLLEYYESLIKNA